MACRPIIVGHPHRCISKNWRAPQDPCSRCRSRPHSRLFVDGSSLSDFCSPVLFLLVARRPATSVDFGTGQRTLLVSTSPRQVAAKKSGRPSLAGVQATVTREKNRSARVPARSSCVAPSHPSERPLINRAGAKLALDATRSKADEFSRRWLLDGATAWQPPQR